MKILHYLPLAIFAVSCQKNTVQPQTLPPVVQKASEPSKPKYKPKKKKPTSSAIKPKVKEEIKPLVVDPTIPDPSKVTPTVTDIPRFEVPENIQPKVADGINLGEFIELKW